MSGVLSVLLAPTAAAAGGGSTWDTVNFGADITFTNSNRTANKQSGFSAYSTAIGTQSRSTGKRYFEIVITSTNFNNSPAMVGLLASNYSSLASNLGNAALGTDSGGLDVRGSLTDGWKENTSFTAGSSQIGAPGIITTGDVLGLAVDLDAGKMWLAKNNDYTFYSTSANPGSGTNEAMDFTANITLLPASSLFSFTDLCTSTLNMTSGQQSFSPPSGFTAWG